MTISREFVLPAGHAVLPGHFPGDPIVPGVILMGWCEELAGQLADAPVIVHDWPNVKFLHPLKPDQVCRVTLKRSTGTQAVFSITSDAQLIATGTLGWKMVNS